MPARSERQRRLLNARFGHAWVKRHGYDNKGKLPERSTRKTSERERLSEAFSKRSKKRRGRG